MVLKSFFPDVVTAKRPLGQYIVERLEVLGDSTAIVEIHSGKEISFEELRNETLKMVELLWNAGLRKGDIVGLVLPFDMQYVPLFIAIIYSGAVLFGTKLLYKSSIHKQLADMKPTVIVTTNDRFDEISEDIQTNVPTAKLCLSFDQLSTVKPGCLRNFDNDMPCYGAINAHSDPAIIYQSSGTTGAPKGIVTTHYGMMASITIIMANSGLCPGDVNAAASPIIHVQSLLNVFSSLCNGITLAYASKLTVEEHMIAISKYKINAISIFNVNTLKGIIEKKVLEPKKHDLSSLQSITVAGTTFSAEIIKEARDKLGTVVAMAYGMTESGPVSYGRSNKVPPNSVGTLFSNLELKVVDKDTGKDLECGQKGELCIRGPQIMKGYFLQDESKLDGLKDGWLHSGDLGYYDKQGYIYVVGRAKDAIKIQPGNVTVMPAELEDILLGHKQIADVAVAGISHPDHGEAPRAFVVRKDELLTEDDVVKFFQSKTEQTTSLHGGVEFVEVIPRTELGKPLRRQLIEKSALKQK